MANREDLEWLYGQESSTPPADRESSTPPAESDRPRIYSSAYSTDTPLDSRSRDSERPRVQPADRPRQPSASRRPRSSASASQRNTSSASERRQQRVERRAPARRRRRFRPLRLVGVLFIAWLIFLIAAPLIAFTSMTAANQSAAAEIADQPGTATLLVGTDSREGLPQEERDRLGTGDAEGARADTIMLLYRPPRGRSVLISLPRDSYVPIEGYGQDKLNAAFAYGGAPLLINTVQNVTGVQIDGYLEIGFGGFAGVVDAVGGIEVCPEAPMYDERANLDLPAGCQTINGPQALGYVRTRYYDAEGDIGRGARQREVIGKVADKVASPATFINPVRYWNLTQSMSQLVIRGDATSSQDLFWSALALANVSQGDGLSLVVPIADPAGWSETGASVVIWDSARARELFYEVSIGDTSNLDRFLA